MRTTKYIVTSVCGDTVNIPTYDIIECHEDELFETLDKQFGGWKTNDFITIYEVGKKIEKPYTEKTLFRVKYPPPTITRLKEEEPKPTCPDCGTELVELEELARFKPQHDVRRIDGNTH